ncbi:energy-coupling factor transporter transmembrane component T family protein [Salisediminibacterium halotolerans]|uniref:energy-coupling factor transporter transmembrane component T family protein n=1 Tax=Salisediminibacterium halotolerans TaxID=517425 RepID=UPI000EB1B219|nr:energy-coupling factor transporter transmembrane protein EcfT [Salisediminibacterium halotolerans]RLJ73107.1 energy-coupling factor transport system permease protein [Actinophytocola xinjiangensis]RPE86529.1 energy-coupling factor transport system permease protein [Salisediminibacterium halotolerans]TWG33904.1 energy-coupling factor transport system permease protein [Salisediminibacterium halotolerans]GEL07438.1 energy-coupling factor transporter transmembrane protein EcfT [Salisediminibacte
MFDHVIIGQYIPGKSFVHALDPRAKLGAVFVFLIFLFLTRDPFALTLALLLAVTAFLLAGIPFRFYLKGMRFIALIILFTFLLHLFMTQEGALVFDFGFLRVYSGGLIEGGLIGYRLFLLITMASMLTLTTTPVDLTDGMERLMKPMAKINVPTHELALMMSIALRFIPTLLGETSKIVKAQMTRGANFSEGSLWKRLKAVIPILVPLFIQSFKRAEDLATAMEARGYAGGEGRTKFRQLRWKNSDTAVMLLFVLFAVWSVLSRWFI